MEDVTIPTYRALVPDAVFGKKAEPIRHSNLGRDIHLTQIMQISKYLIPTRDEIINLIQNVAGNPNFKEEGLKEYEVPFLNFISELPEIERKKIAMRNPDALNHLRLHCSQGHFQPGQTYLNINNGVIPNEILDLEKRNIKERGTMAYEQLMSKFDLENWRLTMKLGKEGGLSDKLEMEYLLDKGVKDCDVFTVNGNYGEYEKVVEQIRLLYNTFSSPQKMEKIDDISRIYLKTRAIKVLEDVNTCFSAMEYDNNIVGGLLEGLAKGFAGGLPEGLVAGLPEGFAGGLPEGLVEIINKITSGQGSPPNCGSRGRARPGYDKPNGGFSDN